MARFRAAVELREVMVAMQRSLLMREHPEASPDEIDRRLEEWVTRRETPLQELSEPLS
ncbi:MAG: hypothetical protein K0U98_18880 [Deltaproteobacteria bacterium]|nr:hypothetical protein [Deltaproteobacteria bacterium]